MFNHTPQALVNEFLNKNPELESDGIYEYLDKYQNSIKNFHNSDAIRVVYKIYIYSRLIRQEYALDALPDSLKDDYAQPMEIYVAYLIELAKTMNDSKEASAKANTPHYQKFFAEEFNPLIHENQEEFEFYLYAKKGAQIVLEKKNDEFSFTVPGLLGHLRYSSPTKILSGEGEQIYNFFKEFIGEKIANETSQDLS
jgi:hypothetical protein